MPMKTVILCGGKGTRLKEETEYKPKPLVEIGGKPILWHIMKIYSHQGFKDFILCLGYKGNMIKEYFLNLREMSNDFILDLGNKEKMCLNECDELAGRVYFINTGQESMTGLRIAKIKKYIGEDEDFFLTYGDGIADIDLNKLYECHKKMGAIATITVIKPVSQFSMLKIEKDNNGGNKISKFEEKPKDDNLIGGGFMVCNRRIFDYLSEDKNYIFEEEPLKKLAEEGKLAAYFHEGFWDHMDTQKDVDRLNEIYEEGAPWEIWKKNNE